MLSFEVKPFEAHPMERALPAVDARLVAEDSGYEVYDGVLVAVPPADEPHASVHTTVLALLKSHAASGFLVACDMLTRTSETSDIAPDASVYERERDPETGGRRIEQLAFEVVSTESMAHAGRKAAMLVGRGVRRVFAVDVEPRRVFEWTKDTAAWIELAGSAYIHDPALSVPLRIGGLLDVAAVDENVARALLYKRTPVLEEALANSLAEGHAKGVLRGIAETVLAVLASRGLSPSSADQLRMLDERDRARLDRWAARAASCKSVSELLAEP